jgi:hypothetical protein
LSPKYTKANPTAPLNQASSWKKSKLKHDGIKALFDEGFLGEQSVDMWNTVAGDAWPLEKNLEEIPMFSLFCEHGLALPFSDFFCRLLEFYKIEQVHLNPNGIFHTSIFVHFYEASHNPT